MKIFQQVAWRTFYHASTLFQSNWTHTIEIVTQIHISWRVFSKLREARFITCVMKTCFTQLTENPSGNMNLRDDFDCMTWNWMELIACVMKTCVAQLTEFHQEIWFGVTITIVWLEMEWNLLLAWWKRASRNLLKTLQEIWICVTISIVWVQLDWNKVLAW